MHKPLTSENGIYLFPVFSRVFQRTIAIYICVNDPRIFDGGQIAIAKTRQSALNFIEKYSDLPRFFRSIKEVAGKEYETVPAGADKDQPLNVFSRAQEAEANRCATELIQRAIHGPGGEPAFTGGPDD